MQNGFHNQYKNTGVTIQDVVTYCRENFDQIWDQEKYKWQSVKHYKSHRDALSNATDENFAEVLAESFSGTENLLVGAMYYPYRMLCKFAEINPKKVQGMLKNLFDESIDLETRYYRFREEADECLEAFRLTVPDREKGKALNHYQDARAISVYLSFEYPNKYYLYKSRMYNKFRDLVGFQEKTEKGQKKTPIWKLETYNSLCEDVLQVIRNDHALSSRLEEAIKNDPSCQIEDAYHLLTQTVIFVGHYTGEKQILAQIHPLRQPDKPDPGEDPEVTDVSKNTILYGPPGTGKTYQTVNYAVSIIENEPLQSIKKRDYDSVLEKYQEYKREGLIEFITFHQSYGYEDFVEGIRPVMNRDSEEETLDYEIVSGAFKSFCEKAAQPVFKEEDLKLNSDPVIWKVSLAGTGDNNVRRECMENGHIRIGWDYYGPDLSEAKIDSGKTILNAFYNKMRIGDLVLSCFSATTIDAIGVVTGDCEWNDSYSEYKRVRPVRWLVKGIQEDIAEINNGSNMTLSTVYRLNISLDDVLGLIRKRHAIETLPETEKKNYVFIIDEINRGNISKIFGELITLIEETKRIGQPEELRVKLPYSQKRFGVPDNVFLLGTMNTADRSIAILDTALRRRFSFVEMQPDLTPLEGLEVEGINIVNMLRRMNERITILYDREHTIGQAYFIPLWNMEEAERFKALGRIFHDQVIPLLQEYFYNDYERIRLVLADQDKAEGMQFVKAIEVDKALFGSKSPDLDDEYRYMIDPAAFEQVEAYKGI